VGKDTKAKPMRKTYVKKYRVSYPTTNELLLAFGKCKIAIRTNSWALRDTLLSYYKGFVTEGDTENIQITVHEAPAQHVSLPFVIKPPDPGKTKIKEEYVDLSDGRIVRKRLTEMLFVFGGGDNVAIGPCLENANQIVNFINNRYIEWRLQRGCLLGHAAGVSLGGRGIALAGFSGMGKSTLALHLMSRGTVFVSNDRIIIEKGLHGLMMHGIAKQPRINPGTALANPDLAGIVPPEEKERFLRLSDTELWNLEHKYDAPIDRCFGSERFQLSSPMEGLFILNWRRKDGALNIRPVFASERKDLLAALRKEKGLFYLPANGMKVQDPPLDSYAEILSDCSVIEMAGGTDFEAAADVCMRFLETGTI
jgi:HprK-related kinase B